LQKVFTLKAKITRLRTQIFSARPCVSQHCELIRRHRKFLFLATLAIFFCDVQVHLYIPADLQRNAKCERSKMENSLSRGKVELFKQMAGIYSKFQILKGIWF
jgi:hypothetical protein